MKPLSIVIIFLSLTIFSCSKSSNSRKNNVSNEPIISPDNEARNTKNVLTTDFLTIPQSVPGFDSLASNNILDAFYDDQSDTLYFATDGGLSITTDGGQTYKTLTTVDGLKSNRVLSVLLTPNGHLFVGSNSGLTIFKKNDSVYEIIERFNSDINNAVSKIVYSDNKVYVLLYRSFYVYGIEQDSLELVSTESETGNASHDITIGTSGTIYVATSSGLKIYSPSLNQENDEISYDKSSFNAANILSSNQVYSIKLVNDNLAIIGNDKGVEVLLKNENTGETTRYGPFDITKENNKRIRQIYHTQNNTFLFTSGNSNKMFKANLVENEDGSYEVNSISFQNFNNQGTFRKVISYKDNLLLVPSSQKLKVLRESTDENTLFDIEKEIEANNGLTNNTVNEIAFDIDGKVLIATDSGINVLEKTEENTYIVKKVGGTRFRNRQVKSIVMGEDDHLYVSDIQRIKKIIKTENNDYTEDSSEIVLNMSYGFLQGPMHIDSDGVIYACTSKGLVIINRSNNSNTFTLISSETFEQMTEGRINDILVEGDFIYLASSVRGIYIFKKDTVDGQKTVRYINNLTEPQLGSNSVNFLTSYDGAIYIGASNNGEGIFRIRKGEDDNFTVTFLTKNGKLSRPDNILAYQDKLYVVLNSTESGIAVVNIDDLSYSEIDVGEGIPTNSVKSLGINDGKLYIKTNSGLGVRNLDFK